MSIYIANLRGGDGVVVKRLACGAEARGSSPGLATMISEIGYLLLPGRDMTEITLKRRKILNQPNPTNMLTYRFNGHRPKSE